MTTDRSETTMDGSNKATTTTTTRETKQQQSLLTSTSSSQPIFISGVQDIINQHDTFLLDMWGVMHNGQTPYEGVLDTIRQLRKQRKRMIILSNSSKRLDHAIRMLHKLGFDSADFDDIITSGEIAHRMLAGDKSLQCQTRSVLTNLMECDNHDTEKKVFVLGSGDGDEEYCVSAGWTLTDIHEANLILARGTFTIHDGSGSSADRIISKRVHGEDVYDTALNDVLEIAAERKLPMLISNPDKVRPDADLSPMPGAIGDAYETILGGGEDARRLVKRIGKPYREVYDLALGVGEVGGGRLEEENDKENFKTACMIGDALETDVTGGSNVGCATLWVVKDGIHSQAVEGMGDYEKGATSVIQDFNEKKGYVNGDGISPTFIAPYFRW